MKQKRLSTSLEDYLEAIYNLCLEKNLAHANKIADRLGVGRSSVSWALNQLSKKDLINYAPYEAITLTKKGQGLAQRLAGRHQAIKDFLIEVLAVDENTAEQNACRMEHVIDVQVLDQMQLFIQPEQELPKVTKERDKKTLDRLRNVMTAGEKPLENRQEIIVATFMSSEKHQTPNDLLKRSQLQDKQISAKLVETTMQILCEYKIARAIEFDGQIVYEHYHPESHHDHIFCVKCGAIVEFFDPRIESLQEENADKADFRLLMHELNIYGVCQECIKQEAKTRPLSDCLTGETVSPVRIAADEKMKKRISDMGLSPGTVIEILNANCAGENMIVLANVTRLMLDRDTAEKIKVTSVQADQRGELAERTRRARHRHAADRPKRKWPPRDRHRWFGNL